MQSNQGNSEEGKWGTWMEGEEVVGAGGKDLSLQNGDGRRPERFGVAWGIGGGWGWPVERRICSGAVLRAGEGCYLKVKA